MRGIPLTKNLIAFVSDRDYKFVSKYKWYARIKKGYTAYAVRAVYVNGKQEIIRMHRFIANAERGQIVDHKNGDGLDNTRSNLRIVTHQENMLNTKKYKNSTSTMRGVSFKRGKWVAQITINRKVIHLGYFLSEKEAAIAYNQKAKNRKQFAKLNSI